MTDEEWKTFFEVCGEVLGTGDFAVTHSESRCSWTTIDGLSEELTRRGNDHRKTGILLEIKLF